MVKLRLREGKQFALVTGRDGEKQNLVQTHISDHKHYSANHLGWFLGPRSKTRGRRFPKKCVSKLLERKTKKSKREARLRPL